MPLPDIQLDDLTFEQLVNEARRRIPAYTPEWTDVNESDPGMTLVQLFAWLHEMVIYRLNKVPQKNYLKFLELIGIDPNPPLAATAELTFTLSAKGLPNPVQINAATQVQADGANGPVIFETDDDLFVAGTELTQVQVYDGAQYQVITSDQRGPGLAFDALSNQPQPQAALLLGFDNPFPAGASYPLTFHAAAPANAPAPVLVGADLTGDSALPADGVWEYWSGSSGQWTALSIDSDTTSALSRSGVVQFVAPPNGSHVAARLGALQRPTDPQLYWIRFRIVTIIGPGYETKPSLEDVLINTITATNIVTETNELLGASDGTPSQVFALANKPIMPKDPTVPGIIAVDENEGNGFVVWTEVKDFGNSTSNDKHYTISLSTGIVTFPDGLKGKIPRFYSSDGSNLASTDTPNIKATSYQWGGGAAGNVAANSITTLNQIYPYVSGVTNLRPATGGQDEETADEASSRAPTVLRSFNRAVSLEDFVNIALSTPNAQIRRAQALPLHHPILSVTRAQGPPDPTQEPTDVQFPGVVTVIVIPYSQDVKPMPTPETLNLVARQLDACRLVTTEVYVTGPKYRNIEIQVNVIADPSLPLSKVRQTLTDTLTAYFNPFTGGPAGNGWVFGASVSGADTMRTILNSKGVLSIVPNSFHIYVDDQVQTTTDVALGPDEVVYSETHDLTVIYQ